MDNYSIKEFIEKIKIESTYRKFIKYDIIEKLINLFNVNYEKKVYPKKIDNPLEIALQFYKYYNKEYYDIIHEELQNKKIIIIKDKGKSSTDLNNNTTLIHLYGNDGDLFIIAHELAHFIDRNSKPIIIPNQYCFLGEVFSFYIEKKLEHWLNYEEYKELISARQNNRIYFESQMLKAIEIELYYENLYKQKGKLEIEDIDIEKIKFIKGYNDITNFVNYLLRYPLANILSDYLIYNTQIKNDYELVEKCININLYELLKKYSLNKTLKKNRNN